MATIQPRINLDFLNGLNLQQTYSCLCNTPSDIYEHLPTLYNYSKKCKTIVEFGVRWGFSTWAFLAALPKHMISYDIEQHPDLLLTKLKEESILNDIDYSFIIGNTLELTIQDTDLLFIDTLHTYTQLKCELFRYVNNVNKYIILHDTVSFGDKGEDGLTPGLNTAINEFLKEYKFWKIENFFSNNNGLTVLINTK